MARACCAKPIVKIIKVGNVEAGLMGLDQAIQNVYIFAINDEEQIKNELLQYIRDFGNYVAPSREEVYKEALLREYKIYSSAIERANEQRAAEERERRIPDEKLCRWKRWFQFAKRGPV